jgi:aryl-alcohol dehydrogenase-like predicted oxidoreductase
VRVGLGCLRISTEDDATIRAALEAGVRVFDTARAYPGSEAQLGRVLAGVAAPFVVTKCGMTRPDGGWQPDGRASAILEDAREWALGRAPDVLLTMFDRRVPFATTVRAPPARRTGASRSPSVSPT